MNKSYLDGYLAALKDYAWWKNGVQYVGCGFQSLEQAKKCAIRDFEDGDLGRGSDDQKTEAS